jgi:putative hydrolase of the HAD superfamily
VTVRAVTFDFWNTLCHVDVTVTAARRRAAWHEHAHANGLPFEPAVLDAVLAHVTEQHHAGWMANRQYTTQHALDEAFTLLGDTLDGAARRGLTDAWLDASRQADVQLTPGLAAVLDALDGAGVRIGIVCDVGLTPSVLLREFLERHAVLVHFDHWSFSDDVGVYKPDPAIFRHALDGLGVDDPAHAVHVGDLRRTDVAGSRAAGMTAVRYRGVFDDPPVAPDGGVVGEPVEGHHVIDDLGALLAIVGIDAP